MVGEIFNKRLLLLSSAYFLTGCGAEPIILENTDIGENEFIQSVQEDYRLVQGYYDGIKEIDEDMPDLFYMIDRDVFISDYNEFEGETDVFLLDLLWTKTSPSAYFSEFIGDTQLSDAGYIKKEVLNTLARHISGSDEESFSHETYLTLLDFMSSDYAFSSESLGIKEFNGKSLAGNLIEIKLDKIQEIDNNRIGFNYVSIYEMRFTDNKYNLYRDYYIVEYTKLPALSNINDRDHLTEAIKDILEEWFNYIDERF